MAGIDNKNAILIESSLLKFASSAAVITIPALDTPGIIASVCMNPIKTIVNILMNFNLFIESFFLVSAKYRIIANIIVIRAIDSTDLILAETKSINSRPIIGNGMEPSIISFRY